MTNSKKRRIGLYGGTFSPPHLGHFHAAREFIRAAELDTLVIMPANIPPHKKVEYQIDPMMRLEMCSLAFGDLEKAEISDFEINKQGVSYTVDTLRAMSGEDRELFMLCGDDMFLTLDTWRCASEIFSLTTIVCMRRYLTPAEPLLLKRIEYEEKYNASVIFTDAPAYPASSTEIREKLKSGESLEGLLSDKVEEYIRKNNLYYSSELR